MALRPVTDLSVAGWLLEDHAAVALRSRLGPSGFAAYARVLHSPDGSGDRVEGHLDDRLLAALVDVLGGHTATPDDCCFALWEGYGDIHGGEAARFLTAFSGGSPLWPGRMFGKERPKAPPPPAFPPEVMDGPLLDVDGQAHFLFTGPLAQAGQWGAASYGGGVPRGINSPNLMWPADRAWFVRTSVEGTWSGVGGSESLIADLLREPRLEVVRQRYDEGALR